MAASGLTGTGPEKIRADAAAINDGVAAAIAEHWEKVWLDPDYRLFLYGTDDPSALPVTGKHAFVVLGFRLQNGEMTDELKGRCDAAAAAALAGAVVPDVVEAGAVFVMRGGMGRTSSICAFSTNASSASQHLA